MSGPERLTRPDILTPILTQAELKQRMKARGDYTPIHVPSPDGGDRDMAAARREAFVSNEERINVLKAGLRGASEMLGHDQAQARLKGYAKARFDKER